MCRVVTTSYIGIVQYSRWLFLSNIFVPFFWVLLDEGLHEFIAFRIFPDNDFYSTRCKELFLAQKRLVLANDTSGDFILYS